MATTNHERVGKALDLLKDGLRPFVERELKAQDAQGWLNIVRQSVPESQIRLFTKASDPPWDATSLLSVMWQQWNDIFRRTLGPAERSLVQELRDHRNNWAHQRAFSGDDTYRALDSVSRLLAAVTATPQVEEVDRMKNELLRLRFDEQVRSERRKSTGTTIESQGATHLKPWRDVITPHQDVASGGYQQAEFAADLWQVHLREGADEYRNPVEFFRRTHLTDSLRRLLSRAVKQLSGGGGDPVVNLQTNFGGGKTHSMLALYHLFSGTSPRELAGIDVVMSEAGAKSDAQIPAARRAVLVGNRISPGNPVTKADGTVVRTLWGELAWQIGEAAGGAKEAKKAFERIRADDEKATNPGDRLRALFNDYAPCLVLIDEWVAYARQLHNDGDLPAGSFETQFTFAQALTESASAAKNCLVVISLPASDVGTSPHALADDVEVGGERGRKALDRLSNVIGRVESSWRPATAEESFEIVRRRLFQPMTDPAQFKDRDVVARAFAEIYRTQQQEFPPECRDSDYEKRITAAYPIHPEIFDRLYGDWSTLVKFQRTRGVLRLMAAVIHSLWEKGDRNPLILPANIAIDDPRVQFELTRYLSDNWVPVIDKDVDGPNALPLRIDGEQPNLGRLAACRRVARTIYLGSAPTTAAAHRGIEDRRIKLGCVMPGESPAVFGDALRRLAGVATYLYADGPRYWYSTQPTVTKLADDRAEQYKRDPDKVAQEIERRLRADLRKTGDFERIHAVPQASQDIPDDLDARLVVLGTEQAYSREAGNSAESAAKALLETRGNAPRIHRNTLVFLAADKTRLQDLEDAVRRFLAWDSIIEETTALNLDPQQVKQAENQLKSADGTVTARLPETYQWLLVPEQKTPQDAVTWGAYRLTGQDALAVRASKRLKNEELLVPAMAGTRLRMELDRIPLWRGDHVSIKQLADDFARYLYLPRLSDSKVLTAAARDGLGLLSWEAESFAYADSYDEANKRYRGLRCGKTDMAVSADSAEGLLVKPDVAAKQQADDDARKGGTPPCGPITDPPPGGGFGEGPRPEYGGGGTIPGKPQAAPALKRFHGAVNLNPARVGADAGRIADEIIGHLVGLIGADVTVTLEIEARIPGGAPENVVRTVTENSRTLKFTSQGFEEE
jgi:predicted AAA+ superfamily ATPase